MFGRTPMNKVLSLMSIHTYPHKSYLPIFDSIGSIKLNWNSVYCCACAGIHFILSRKVHNARSSKNT